MFRLTKDIRHLQNQINYLEQSVIEKIGRHDEKIAQVYKTLKKLEQYLNIVLEPEQKERNYIVINKK